MRFKDAIAKDIRAFAMKYNIRQGLRVYQHKLIGEGVKMPVFAALAMDVPVHPHNLVIVGAGPV